MADFDAKRQRNAVSGTDIPFGATEHLGVLAAQVDFATISGSAAYSSGDAVNLFQLGAGQIVFGAFIRHDANSNVSAAVALKVSGHTGQIDDSISASSFANGDYAFSAMSFVNVTSGAHVFLSVASSASGLTGKLTCGVMVARVPTNAGKRIVEST